MITITTSRTMMAYALIFSLVALLPSPMTSLEKTDVSPTDVPNGRHYVSIDCSDILYDIFETEEATENYDIIYTHLIESTRAENTDNNTQKAGLLHRIHLTFAILKQGEIIPFEMMTMIIPTLPWSEFSNATENPEFTAYFDNAYSGEEINCFRPTNSLILTTFDKSTLKNKVEITFENLQRNQLEVFIQFRLENRTSVEDFVVIDYSVDDYGNDVDKNTFVVQSSDEYASDGDYEDVSDDEVDVQDGVEQPKLELLSKGIQKRSLSSDEGEYSQPTHLETRRGHKVRPKGDVSLFKNILLPNRGSRAVPKGPFFLRTSKTHKSKPKKNFRFQRNMNRYLLMELPETIGSVRRGHVPLPRPKSDNSSRKGARRPKGSKLSRDFSSRSSYSEFVDNISNLRRGTKIRPKNSASGNRKMTSKLVVDPKIKDAKNGRRIIGGIRSFGRKRSGHRSTDESTSEELTRSARRRGLHDKKFNITLPDQEILANRKSRKNINRTKALLTSRKDTDFDENVRLKRMTNQNAQTAINDTELILAPENSKSLMKNQVHELTNSNHTVQDVSRLRNMKIPFANRTAQKSRLGQVSRNSSKYKDLDDEFSSINYNTWTPPSDSRDSKTRSILLHSQRFGQDYILTIHSLYTECRNNYSCFSFPSQCYLDRNCFVTMAYNVVDKNKIHVALAAKNTNYVAVGFSKDSYMGDDIVIICKRAPGNDRVSLWVSHNPGDSEKRRNIVEEFDHGVKVISSSVYQGRITCDFTIPFQMKYSGVAADFKSKKYHILLALGVDNMEPNEPGSITYHGFAISSQEAISLTSSKHKIVTLGTHILLTTHIVCGVICYTFCIPMAILMARYGQQAFPCVSIKGYPAWIICHISLQSVAILLNTLGVVVAFVGRFGSAFTSASPAYHFVIGTFLALGVLVNGVAGFFVHRERSKKLVVNGKTKWCHYLLGHCIYAFGAVELIRGPYLRKSFVSCSFSVVAGFYLLFYTLAHIVLEFNTDYLRRLQQIEKTAVQALIGPALPLDSKASRDEYDVRRGTILFMFYVSALYTVVLVTLIFMSNHSCNPNDPDYIHGLF